MNVREVAELLQTRIGLDPLSLGSNLLSSIVAKRLHALGMTDPERYAVLLKESAEEFTSLVEEVVVPETWFFRGGNVFAYLADQVRRWTESASPTERFRILSAPCSSGEEAYSMMIALLEAGVPRERWSVEGIDLSARSLAKARQGIYREPSFRETPALLRHKYFHPAPGGSEITPTLRDLVQFRPANLLDPNLLVDEKPFDLIFCRNLLIYLHAEARRCVLANLNRLLTPQGLLCMGHAEPMNLLDPRFEPIGPESYFLFQRKKEPLQTRPVPNGRAPITVETHVRPGKPALQRPKPRSLPAASTSPVAPTDLLFQARREADAGSLDKALQSCQAHLAVAISSASAYSLLGIIHRARQERSKAIDCFRRALYLDPQHEEALLHLLLLYQEDGNEPAALRLRRRLERKTAGGKA